MSISKEIIIFIGPEGSGKTTVSKLLVEESGALYLTSGDILRDLAKNNQGELGDKVRNMFADHVYLDGQTLLNILGERFSQDDTSDGFILDGGLRTLEETVKFQDMLVSAGRAFPVTVVHLEIPESISIERLVTGENARKRTDDTMEGVKLRLAQYRTFLEERLEIIKSLPNWKLVNIDASKPVLVVYEAVCQAITEEWRI